MSMIKFILVLAKFDFFSLMGNLRILKFHGAPPPPISTNGNNAFIVNNQTVHPHQPKLQQKSQPITSI
jgi:hypothetical protein